MYLTVTVEVLSLLRAPVSFAVDERMTLMGQIIMVVVVPTGIVTWPIVVQVTATIRLVDGNFVAVQCDWFELIRRNERFAFEIHIICIFFRFCFNIERIHVCHNIGYQLAYFLSPSPVAMIVRVLSRKRELRKN